MRCVPHALLPVQRSDRLRAVLPGCLRVGGAQQLPPPRHRVLGHQLDAHHQVRGHELRELREEVLALVLGVELLGVGELHPEHLDVGEGEVVALDGADDLADVHVAVGLDHGVGPE